MDLSILDKPIRLIMEALSGVSREEARALLAAEEAGKTRKGVVELLEELTEEAPRDPCLVRNIVPGTTLHLGDGRKLAFGEEARVSPEQAQFMRERGQAE
jgi:hypothetical protein